MKDTEKCQEASSGEKYPESPSWGIKIAYGTEQEPISKHGSNGAGGKEISE
jgi:hypothetical protein